MSLEELQRIGFPMGGEPLVALDLADTVLTATEPVRDLLDSPERVSAWWEVELRRLPDSPTPGPEDTRGLRAAMRELFDAQLAGRTPRAASVEEVNATAAAVPASPRLVYAEAGEAGEARVETHWHTEHGGNVALAAVAREAIDLLSSPERRTRLRRCANPACSMVFLAETTRRQWCASNVCGNRMRVARHYRRTRSGEH